jgi:hypothetical protein
MELEIIFAPDEMNLKIPRANWSARELLGQQGIFFLKDIVGILDLTSAHVKKAAREIKASGRCPYRVMGARKVWNHWTVRMTVFRSYYQRHLMPKVKQVERKWTGNELLDQAGIFVLADVCRLLPFKAHQLRYQAKKEPNSRQLYGVWKDPDIGLFVVDMEPFAKWIKKLWKGGFR